MNDESARAVATDTSLMPLTPRYEASEHQTYVDAIESALAGEHGGVGVRNIALTGSYGVGKSSILQEVADRNEKKIVQISLSTLGLADVLDADPASGAAVTKTNLIQKEIVKQLLYREDPEKMPGSRYRRIGRFKFWRQVVQAALAGVVVALVFFLAGWTQRIAELLAPRVTLGDRAHLAVFVAATLFALALEWLFHNRLHIGSVTAGPTTITLSGESATYFDEYLDEIVYFFDVTGRDIVIFEDIDRFDDPHIFETLRALNGLLNRAGQLDGRSIRFIYAIKDSIFDELGVRAAREEGDIEKAQKLDAVDLEIARTNRTKFFDLVIPVVPFITHRSARDLMDTVMKDSGSTISNELIDLAARHLVDMRLIKNIRNEFVIFRQKVLGGDGSQLGLSENALFAMMLYKSTHLSDFEDIKLGKSRLDRLYRDYRQLVTENMSRLASEETNLRKRLTTLNSVDSRSDGLGQELLNYIGQLQRHVEGQPPTLRYGRMNHNADHFKTTEFWEGFLSGDQPVQVSTQQPNGQTAVFSLTRSRLEEVFGKSLSPKDWQTGDRAQIRERLRAIKKDRDFLRSAELRDLYDRDEFKLRTSGAESRSLRELVAVHLGSELAQELLAAGHIDRNFTLYTSTYYANRVSSQATNFMIHSVDPNVMDPHFTLSADDVEAVLRERGESVLRQRGMYNISVLDHLLEQNDKRVELPVQALKNKGDDERQFLVAYFASGNKQDVLVSKLADWPRILTFLFSEAELSDEAQMHLLDVALGHIDGETEYETDDAIREYFERVYAELPINTSESTTAERAGLIAGLFAAASVRLADLSRVAPEVRYAMVAANLYVVDRGNLMLALGEPESLALDAIKASDDRIYAYVLDNLGDYLEALHADDPSTSIEQPNAFAEILDDLADHDESQLAEVIAQSAPECRVQSLSEVPESTWPWLADNKRFSATVSNVMTYIGESGQIDDHLAGLLKAAGSIEGGEDAEESEKTALAKSILEARTVLPEPNTRVGLVSSLGLEDWLALDAVPREAGELVGLLIEAGVVSDDADTYELALGLDWKTREFAITKSEEFVSYMDPSLVPVGDISQMLRSETVPEAVKNALVARSAEFVAEADHPTLTALAQYATGKRRHVVASELLRWALAGVDAQLIVGLLATQLPSMSAEDLVPVLNALRGDYADISVRNGKRPRIANTESNLALVARLEQLGIVSSYETDTGRITVNMRKPE